MPDDLAADFDEFWSLVPRKEGKKDARRAYKKARNLADKAVIHTGIARYAQYVEHRLPEHIAHPATWLNGERWEDELPAPRPLYTKMTLRELQLHQRLDATREYLAKPH